MEEHGNFARRHEADFGQRIQGPFIGEFEVVALADQGQGRDHFGERKMVAQAEVAAVGEGQEGAPGPIRGGEALGAERVGIGSQAAPRWIP